LHLLERSEIVRAGVDSDAGQYHRQLQIVSRTLADELYFFIHANHSL
jgi:hypothetical protein